MKQNLHARPIRWMLCLLGAVVVMLAAGCGGGGPTFPPPRPSVEDDEPATKPTKPPKPAAKATQASALASNTNPPPQTRAEGIAQAAAEASAGQLETDGVAPPPPPTVPSPPPTDDDAVKPSPPEHPVDFSAWRREDFLTAQQDSDQRLFDAVAFLGRKPDDAAAMLASLLERSEGAGSVFPERVSISQTTLQKNTPDPLKPDARLVEAVVVALVSNGSHTAHRKLREMLAGTFESEVDDRTLVKAVLKALAGDAAPESENLLALVLTRPEQVRPQGHAALLPLELQQECVRIVGPGASPRLRAEIARYVSRPGTTIAHRQQLIDLISTPDEQNLEAQTIFYASPVIDAGLQTQWDERFAQLSADAAETLIQFSRQPAGDEDEERALQEAAARRARILWSPSMIETVTRRLGEVDDFARHKHLLQLAVTLPHTAVRAKLRELLLSQWEDGEVALAAADISPDVIRDPGLLAVWKTMPREEPPKKIVPVSNTAAAKKQQQQSLAKQAWFASSRNLLDEFKSRCMPQYRTELLLAMRNTPPPHAERENENPERGNEKRGSEKKKKKIDTSGYDEFYPVVTPQPPPRPAKVVKTSSPAAVDAGGNSLGSANDASNGASTDVPPPDVSTLPLRIQENTTALEVRQLTWPEDLYLAAPGIEVSPLEVHYARLEIEDAPHAVVTHYENQLRTSQRRNISGGVWLDGVRRDAEARSLVSADVTITKSKQRPSQGGATRLDIELLWIEIPDPTHKTMNDE